MTQPSLIDRITAPRISIGRVGAVAGAVVPWFVPAIAVVAVAIGLVGAWTGNLGFQTLPDNVSVLVLPLAGLAVLYLPIWLILACVSPGGGRYRLAGRLIVGTIVAFVLLFVSDVFQVPLRRHRVDALVEERVAAALEPPGPLPESFVLPREDFESATLERLEDRSLRAVVQLRRSRFMEPWTTTYEYRLDRSGQIISRTSDSE